MDPREWYVFSQAPPGASSYLDLGASQVPPLTQAPGTDPPLSQYQVANDPSQASQHHQQQPRLSQYQPYIQVRNLKLTVITHTVS
jgi:hypothetical protein